MIIKLRKTPTYVAVTTVSFFNLCLFYKLGHIILSKSSSSAESIVILPLGALLISAFFLFVSPIKQSQSYHNFADKRIFLCSCHALRSEGYFLPPGTTADRSRRQGFTIPNFGDVISNIVILSGGALGIIILHLKEAEETIDSARRWQLEICLPIFFYATIAISIGSTYYHWNPHDASLVWDRLPMTLAFVSIFCFMLEEYNIPNIQNNGIGQAWLFPLLLIGIFSVLYWKWFDDLRLYALVQFLPLIIIAMLLLCCEPKHDGGGSIAQILALTCYGLAKLAEDRDYEIYNWTNNIISGHSLKHCLAGLSSIFIAFMLL